jgi:hypothetical protein
MYQFLSLLQQYKPPHPYFFFFLTDVVFFQAVLDLHKIIPVTNLLQIASIIVIMTPLFN